MIIYIGLKMVVGLPDHLFPRKILISPRQGEKGAICMAPTMDSMILRQLLTSFLEGSQILKERTYLETGECVQEMAEEILGHLPPIALTKDGRIREWQEDYPEVELGHRHISHLYGLYPGHEITEENEDLFQRLEKRWKRVYPMEEVIRDGVNHGFYVFMLA